MPMLAGAFCLLTSGSAHGLGNGQIPEPETSPWDWSLSCSQEPEEPRDYCSVRIYFQVDRNTGVLSVLRSEGEWQMFLLVRPTEEHVVVIDAARFQVDANAPVEAPVCAVFLCLLNEQAPVLVEQMRIGRAVRLAIDRPDGEAIAIKLPLARLAAALDALEVREVGG